MGDDCRKFDRNPTRDYCGRDLERGSINLTRGDPQGGGKLHWQPTGMGAHSRAFRACDRCRVARPAKQKPYQRSPRSRRLLPYLSWASSSRSSASVRIGAGPPRSVWATGLASHIGICCVVVLPWTRQPVSAGRGFICCSSDAVDLPHSWIAVRRGTGLRNSADRFDNDVIRDIQLLDLDPDLGCAVAVSARTLAEGGRSQTWDCEKRRRGPFLNN